MKKIYKVVMIFCTGAISTFAIPPFSFYPTIFFLGFSIYKISFLSSLRQTFLAGWVLGFSWFLFGLYWIGSAFIVADTYHIYFMPFAVILLPSLLAIFWGLAFLLAKLFTRNKASSLVMVILFLSLFEYFRAFVFTGFPWLMPSMALSGNEYFLQIFSFVGSFGSNVVVITLCVLPFVIFSNLHRKVILFFIFFVPIAILFISSFLRFYNKEIQETNNQLVTIVQPNIKQKDKWNIEKRETHLKKLIDLSSNEQGKENDLERLIIWPETSFAGFIPNEKLALSSIAKKVLKNSKTKLVVGLLRVNQNNIYNSLVFLNSDGKIIYEYDKLHLVPFGEYIPLRYMFRKVANYFSQKDFTGGNLKPNINLDGFGDIITIICYEILFSSEINKRISKKLTC
jgi:apolipoprotein N-acyltransferase